MIALRRANEIYEARGQIENGTFEGRWHFSFDTYDDPDYVRFGTLRVFNDDTLSPGAIWPLHPHREIEVVTYCAEGEFRHADEHGVGGILQKGWVQHTTVGKGMYHAEINNDADKSMRFIQMWFIPSQRRLEPAIQQMRVAREDRANRFLLLVSNQIDARPNGPLHVRGRVRIVGTGGQLIREDTRIALCRCGASENKPYCDGSHRRVGFRATNPPKTSRD